MPYLIQVRMRANCAGEIEGVDLGSRLTEAFTSATRVGGGGVTRSTRGLRGEWSAGGSALDGTLTGGFAVKSASAASRALEIRSRSWPREYLCSCRSNKDDA